MKLRKTLRRWAYPRRWGNLRQFEPASRSFGYDRGTPVDRVYMQRFLQLHASFIRGRVLEIGDNQYTRMFGRDVEQSVVLAGNVPGVECYEGDLTNLQTLGALGKFDCVIVTQVLNFIFDLEAAMMGIRSLLKNDGVVLATLAGLVPVSRYDAQRWGDYWRFSDMSARKLFAKHFGDQVDISVFGNLISTTAILHGLSAEELSSEEMAHVDADYQVLIGVKAQHGS